MKAGKVKVIRITEFVLFPDHVDPNAFHGTLRIFVSGWVLGLLQSNAYQSYSSFIFISSSADLSHYEASNFPSASTLILYFFFSAALHV